jgi:hypothetical protein
MVRLQGMIESSPAMAFPQLFIIIYICSASGSTTKNQISNLHVSWRRVFFAAADVNMRMYTRPGPEVYHGTNSFGFV